MEILCFVIGVFRSNEAILDKVGVNGICGNLSTVIRTSVVLFLAWGIVLFNGQLKEVKKLSKANWIFLILSGLATGLS